MDYIFPGKTEVFASWFTGELRLPQGEILDYFHGGFLTDYEWDLFLAFKDGILICERMVNNRIKPKEKPKEIEIPITKEKKGFWKRLFGK